MDIAVTGSGTSAGMCCGGRRKMMMMMGGEIAIPESLYYQKRLCVIKLPSHAQRNQTTCPQEKEKECVIGREYNFKRWWHLLLPFLSYRHASDLLVLFQISMRTQSVQFQTEPVLLRYTVNSWQLINVSRLIPKEKRNSDIQMLQPGLVFKGSMHIYTQLVQLWTLPFFFLPLDVIRKMHCWNLKWIFKTRF